MIQARRFSRFFGGSLKDERLGDDLCVERRSQGGGRNGSPLTT